MKHTYLLGASLIALGIALPQIAAAQEAPRTDNGTIEEVVVTANKREQSLQDVPISLSAISGKLLEDRAFTQFTDLQSAVPNLQIDQTNGNFALTIRGLGAGAGNLSFEQSVGLFVDGVYSSRARTLQVPFLDVERIEVVRGPQGALFGKNTNAGAISLISRKPGDVFEAEARASVEAEHGGYAASGFVSGPVSDTVAMRLSGSVGYAGPYINNVLEQRHENANSYYALRGQVSWKPTENFDALLKLEGFNNGINGANAVYNSLGIPTCALCNLQRNATGGINAQEIPGFWRAARPMVPEFDHTRSGNATLTANWTIDDWQVTAIASYMGHGSKRQFNAIGGALPILYTVQPENFNQLLGEVRVARTFMDRVDVTAGVTYVKTKLSLAQNAVYNGGNVVATLPIYTADRPFTQHGDSLSPYLAVDYTPVDNLTLSGSVRYSAEEKKARIAQVITSGTAPATNLPYDLRGKRNESLWDYSFKALYTLDENASFYASYATGTKGGGFISNNATLYYDILNNGARLDYEPEKAKSWEVGGKFFFLDRRANLNIALFNTNFENLQVSSYNGITFLTNNAAKALSRGVEVDGNYRLTREFMIGMSGAYLDAKYDDYPGGACPYNAAPGCTPATNNLAGYRLIRAPMWKGSAFIQAETDVGRDLHVVGRLSADHTSTANLQPDMNPLNAQPTFTKFDARVALSPLSAEWELSINGRNLTNKATWGQAFTTPILGGNSHVVMVNPARTVTVEAVYRY